MKASEQIMRDLDFLYEIGSLRYVDRGWRQHLGGKVATDPEHTFRVMYVALLLARMEGKPVDEHLLLKMALVHDIAETRTSDHSYVQKVYVTIDEEKAAEEVFANTTLADLKDALFLYEKRECWEAKLVKDADNLDVDIELRELEYQGVKLAEMWRKSEANRVKVRNEKLYTESARKVWDAIGTSDPHNWHMSNNKWGRIKDAGK